LAHAKTLYQNNALVNPVIIKNHRTSYSSQSLLTTNTISLQRVSIACYAERCISYSKSVRPSVGHTLALCQNDSSYDHAVMVNFGAKFQREHMGLRERERRMKEG